MHWSTAQVSGARSGVILEEELDCGQRFRNVYEETKFRAERMVRDAARRLPITILRPGIIVGDSKTGEIDKFDGPYYLLVLIVSSPIDVHLPLPGRGNGAAQPRAHRLRGRCGGGAVARSARRRRHLPPDRSLRRSPRAPCTSWWRSAPTRRRRAA